MMVFVSPLEHDCCDTLEMHNPGHIHKILSHNLHSAAKTLNPFKITLVCQRLEKSIWSAAGITRADEMGAMGVGEEESGCVCSDSG